MKNKASQINLTLPNEYFNLAETKTLSLLILHLDQPVIN